MIHGRDIHRVYFADLAASGGGTKAAISNLSSH
jgi:hypothetical protein